MKYRASSPARAAAARRSRRWAGSAPQLSSRPSAKWALPATDTEAAPFILWLATIQCIESKQDLASLAPKNCFIPAKPVERIAGQIGEAQKATRGRWRDQRILAQSGAHFLFRL